MDTVRSVLFVLPGSLKTRTGGYTYDRRLVSGLRDRGWTVEVKELDASFPRPTPQARGLAVKFLASVPDDTVVVFDGLALGALPDELERHAERLRVVALIHHPLALETGLDADVARELDASERRALSMAREVVVTSRATAMAMTAYGVDTFQINVVEPGTDRAGLAHGAQNATIELLTVGTLIPRKGHSVLFRALASVPFRNWKLTCVGSLDRDRPTAARLRAQLSADKLSDRVRLVGDVDPEVLGACYERADVFVLPTFHEGYGMAVAEALARGLPVISTRTGAIPELVRDDAGLLVPAGDIPALAAALTDMVGDVSLRHRLAEGARRVRDSLPTWEDAARKFAGILDHVTANGRVYL
jgi:glycosyltransferase involved in cell wall biosynthesis